MKSISLILWILAGSAIQMLLPPVQAFGSIEWPVLTALLIGMALRLGWPHLMVAAVLCGLAHDSFSLAPLGFSIPFFVAIAAGVYAIREEIFGDQFISLLLLGVLSVFLKVLYFGIFLAITGLRPVPGGAVFGAQVVGGLILGGITVPMVCLAVSALRKIIPHRRRRFL